MTTRSEGELLDLLVRLWRSLSRDRRRQFWLLISLMPVSALAEVISLGAVLPFLATLIAPERAIERPFVARIAHFAGVTSPQDLALFFTIAFVAAAVIASAIRMLLLWASIRLAVAAGSDISTEAYRRTLYQPYRVHVARNSSEVISGVTDKVNAVVFGVMLPLLTLMGSAVLVLAVTLALISVNPVVALQITVGFAISYGAITWFARRRLRRNSERVAREQNQVVKALQEGLGGIRDVLLDGAQSIYCDIYRQSDLPLRRAHGNNVFIGQSPRYSMEALGMVMIAVLAYVLSQRAGGVAAALPMLGALALGAQRLLPALQQSYGTWASIVGTQASLATMVGLLEQPLDEAAAEPAARPRPFNTAIQFRNVSFRYTDDGPWVIQDLNLVIAKGARIGFVGTTGSGKSTLMDLLMGLLLPTEGSLLVDGDAVTDGALKSWQRAIAHVPQSIFLSDATLAENIAFGVQRDAIDMTRVRHAARQAQIADFIEGRPEGYDAHVGERGVRLSGGQRQRIGIARALYKQASVLVFDEATSALDNSTEESVMNAIEGLDRDLTILIIAHRLSTVRRCDRIIELEQGRLVNRTGAGSMQDAVVDASPSRI
ncbi:MAG: ABC transporter ATP-binding protein/permease [Acidobacteriota bacterium]|nr:ABC transporter ATP-binding protein/permease [Acidobacteriota bacterium]